MKNNKLNTNFIQLFPDDSGNSCGSSIVSEFFGNDDHEECVLQVSDLEEINDCVDEELIQIDDNNDTTTSAITTTAVAPSATKTVAHPNLANNHHLSLSANNNNNNNNEHLAVLSYEQIARLNDVMEQTVSIVGRGNFPTIEVRLRDLVEIVRNKLEAPPTTTITTSSSSSEGGGGGGAGMRVRDIRLNGGAASHVLTTRQTPPTLYNDVDLIFAIDQEQLSMPRNFDRIKMAILNALYDMLPDGVMRHRISTCSLKEAYVSKMVKVSNQTDRWSLISLGCQRGRGVELKFVDRMRRQFEFSVDSFQIVLDSLLMFYRCAPTAITPSTDGRSAFSENFYPTVVGESIYGDFGEALSHLERRLIATKRPEEIRGGGLLKYCALLVKNYRPAHPDYIRTLERYMCSRFFIDFPDVMQQRAKLENYLWNHFADTPTETVTTTTTNTNTITRTEGATSIRHRFLLLLHDVVAQSTVCLMGHERRQTLQLIKTLAWQVMYQDQQSAHQQQQQQRAPPHQQQQQIKSPTNHSQHTSAAFLVANNGYIYATTPITLATPPCQFCGCGSTWMTTTTTTTCCNT